MLPVRAPRLPSLALVAGLLLAPVPVARALDPVESAAKEEVTASAARSVAGTLAGTAFEGRGTLQPGNEAAARWLAKELRKAGFEPAFAAADGDKDPGAGYLQWFDVKGRDGSTAGKTPNVVGILRGDGRGPGRTATSTPSPAAEPPPPAEGAAPGGAAAADAAEPTREYLVLGAHFDHLGVPNRKPDDRKPAKKSQTFFGADDNASGSTAALLVARALGRMKTAGTLPRRDVVVAFFSGEEHGLLGSKHYCAEPPVPLPDTVAMLNLDMVGRNSIKTMEVYGNTSSPELDAAHRTVLEKTEFDCTYPGGDVFTRSDHYSFYERKIPVLFFHGGLHKDYHTQRDTVDKLDFRKVERIARHTLGVLWLVVNAPDRPSFRTVDMTGAGGKLGLAVDPAMPDELDELDMEEDRGAVRVTTVFAGGLGEKFFEPGDVIYSWNGYPFDGENPVGRFQTFVQTAKAGSKITLRYVRGKERKACVVQF